jgi:hypothetical protein
MMAVTAGASPAYLGEVVVHAQDIRQPLGLVRTPGVDALTPVADFFALALVMSMAGRVAYAAELDSPGAPTLRSRLQVTAA